MSDKTRSTPAEDLQQIIVSAQRLGIEIDEADALQWMTAMAAMQVGSDVVVDEASGVFGHRISMLDFSPDELAHFRRIGQLVGFDDQPGVVETALAISGSAAQSKIQTYPGDADYFERVNIKADSRPAACKILAEIMRKKAIDTAKGSYYQLIELKYGAYPQDVVKGGQSCKAGSPIAWLPDEVQTGQIEAFLADGSPCTITWDAVSGEPGWCK